MGTSMFQSILDNNETLVDYPQVLYSWTISTSWTISHFFGKMTGVRVTAIKVSLDLQNLNWKFP
jgi:hypothetical protein